MSSSKMITLKTYDGEIFKIDEEVAIGSKMIKHMIEDNCVDTIIPLPNVASNILAKVIQYLKHHGKESSSNDLKSFDTNFVQVEDGVLFHLMSAANYLNIKSLLELACKSVVDMMNDKTTEQIREIFNIENDFTPEEEEEVRRENAWAFEGT